MRIDFIEFCLRNAQFRYGPQLRRVFVHETEVMAALEKTLKSINLDKESVFKFVENLQKDPNFTLIAVGVALVVVLISILLLKLLRGSSKGNNVLLVGLSESGKTVMFAQLYSKRFVETVTSMKPLDASLEINKKLVNVVDLPGYERLREKFWDDYKSSALGIIFVVDSVAFMSNIRDVAALLYSILSDPVVTSRKVPVCVACNKQDNPKAKSAKVIQNQLEKEINIIRETRGSQLSYTDEGGDGGTGGSLNTLGDPNKEFLFSGLKSNVEFVDCSSKFGLSEEARLDDIWKWLQRNV